MKFLALIMFFVSQQVFAEIKHAPQAFAHKDGKAIFVDFDEANYKITYDGATQTQKVVATIRFESFEDGYPIFDLVAEPTSVAINGTASSQALIKTPNGESSIRVLGEKVKAGVHMLEIVAPLTQTVRYTAEGVNSAFWFSDLSDRAYLEAYVPANYEYDQVKMTFEMEFLNLKAQTFYTNGTLSKLADNKFKIEFPEYFTASSMFLHTAPVGRYPELSATYKSIDGRELPITIYSTNTNPRLETYKSETLKVLKELENDYGPFPHQKVVIFDAGSGGMEYCGATMTEFRALGHELTHSYFARGVMPANGNAGWLDEAIASWRDNGYPQVNSVLTTTQMASRAPYTRKTDRNAYTVGAKFMGFLHKKLLDKGGMKKFLADLVEKRTFDPLVTEEFVKMLNEFYGVDVKADFDRVAYGKNTSHKRSVEPSHPFHQKMSLKDYQDML